MPTQAISTDRQVSALKPAETKYEVAISGARGLVVHVYPNAAKMFGYRYTATNGARRRHVLGAYPDLSLAEAKDKAAALRIEVLDGGDPAAERASEAEKARTGETLDQLAEAFWAAGALGLHGGRKRPKSPTTIAKERSNWMRHVSPRAGGLRVQTMRRGDIKALMTALVKDTKLAPASIADIGGLVHAVLAYGVLEDRLEFNPAAGQTRPLEVKSRDRLIRDDALAVILRAAIQASTERAADEADPDPGARMGPTVGLAVQFLIRTLTRRAEVAGARRDEIDRSAMQWIIPAERAKARHMHVVPLTESMLQVVDRVEALHPGSKYIFPGIGPELEHLDPHTITRAFARIVSRHRLPHGSPHDIRRSGATTLIGQYGVRRHVAGLLLGHTVKEGAAVTSVYDRYSYLPEKRAALEAWETHLVRLVGIHPDLTLKAPQPPPLGEEVMGVA
jgi:integrase